MAGSLAPTKRRLAAFGVLVAIGGLLSAIGLVVLAPRTAVYRAALDAKAELELTPTPGADVSIGELRDVVGFRYRVSEPAGDYGGHGTYYRITNLVGQHQVCFIVDAGERYPTIAVQRGRC